MKRSLLVLLLLAAPAFGQAPPPPGPVARLVAKSKAPINDDVVLNLAGTASEGDPDVLIDPSSPRLADGSPAASLEFSYDKAGKLQKVRAVGSSIGTYRFFVVAYGKAEGPTRPPVAIASADVTMYDPDAVAPAPIPAPQPPDDRPKPTPVDSTPIVAGHIYATLFYDINDLSVGSIRESAALQEELAKLDCNLYKLATTAPAAQPFAAELAAVGTPCILFQVAGWAFVKGPDGKAFALKSPKSPADVIAQVRKLRGVAQ